MFSPFWCFNSTPTIRHNFKSIDALLSPSPTSSYKNGKLNFYIDSDKYIHII
jgi:hypothetical protein